MRHRQDHPEDVEGCFGCKIMGLELGTGDANAQKSMSNKKWDAELNAYSSARAEGIQPAGTTMAKIQDARRASDALGAAYNAESMPASTMIKEKNVSKLKEVGLV